MRKILKDLNLEIKEEVRDQKDIEIEYADEPKPWKPNETIYETWERKWCIELKKCNKELVEND